MNIFDIVILKALMDEAETPREEEEEEARCLAVARARFAAAHNEKQNKWRSTLPAQKTFSQCAFDLGRAFRKFRNAKSIRASHAENEAFEAQ